MPKLIVNKLEHALEDRFRKRLVNANILVVGVTYKPDIADIRESAALRVMDVALSRGARVAYHDPLMPQVSVGGTEFQSVDLDEDELGVLDAVVLLTPHTSVDYERIIGAARLVIDTHSGLQPRAFPNVVNVWVPDTAPAPVPT
jgi:UDP-N-acetyl-D-glucosamine dehydrogenase